MNVTFTMPALAKIGEDGGFYLEGVASTTDLDQHKEQMSMSALQDMAKARNVRLVKDGHRDEISDHIGDLVESSLNDGEYYTKFKMDAKDPEAMRLWNKINDGMHAGLSVGGKILSTAPGEGMTKRFITGVELEHVALTLKPANPKTMVQAFAKTIEAMNLEDNALMETTELNKTEAVDVVDVLLAKTEELSKEGRVLSADTKAKIKSIAEALGLLIGDDEDDVVIGANEPAKTPEPPKAEIVANTAPIDEISALVKTAVAEAFATIKTERKGVAVTDELEKTETPAERMAKTKSLLELRSLFSDMLNDQK